MKKLLTLLAISLAVVLSSCSTFDDEAIWNKLDDHESRISRLEEMCREMNSNIDALQAIVTALQTNDYVTSVTPVTKDGETIGYTITFTKSDPITIYHGTDGKDGGYTPIIGVKQDADGIYYWTLDGEWLLDENGNKIKAQGTDGKDGINGADGKDGVDGADGKDGIDGADGKDGINGTDGKDGADGITPLLKIENDYWYISYDNGASWTQLGKATGEDGKDGIDGANGADGMDGKDGDSFFQSVTQDEQFVYFTLADGTVITLPKGAALDITFAESDLVVMSPNSTREIDYTVTSVTEKVTVEVTSSADIRAKVVTADATGKRGSIKITTGSTIDEYSKVIVFVSNGDKVIMRSITFEEAGLMVEENATLYAAAEGGEVALHFLTNVECSVAIPEEAQDWISVVPATRAMERQTITLQLEPNEGYYRSADVIVFHTSNGQFFIEFTIEQMGKMSADIDPSTVPDNEIWYVTSNNTVYDINKVTERWGHSPFDANVTSNTYQNGYGIIKFDTPVTEIRDHTFGVDGYAEDIVELYLPDCIESIGGGAIHNTRLTTLHIPKNLNYVGSYGLSNLHLESFTGEHVSEDGRCVIIEDGFMPYYGNTRVPVKNYMAAFAPAGVTEYTLPNNVEVLGWYVFRDCAELRKISFNEGLKAMMGDCFLYTHLDCEITLPTTLESFEPSVFNDCSGIKGFYGNEKFHTSDHLCLLADEGEWLIRFVGYDITDYSIPEGIKGIMGHAFEKMPNLKTVTLPSSIVEVKPNAFYYCVNLEALYGECVSDDHKAIILGTQFIELVVTKDVVSYTIPDNITSIGSRAFAENGEIETITMGDQITHIEDYAFAWCPNLKSITLSAGLKDISGCNAFLRSVNLESIYCRALTPPLYNDTQMNEFPKLKFYVPEQSLSLYQNDAGWAPFREYFVGYRYEDLPELEYYVSTDYSQDGVVTTLQTATKGNGIDIVLMGDAYSDRQIADGTYRTDMEYIYNNLFTEEPYKSFKDHFNVHYVNVVSAAEGYEYGKTALDGYFGDGTLVGGNDNAVFDYALNAISEEEMDEALLIVAMNSDNYAGTCYMYWPTYTTGTYGSGPSVAYFPRGGDAETFAQLLHHEACGHGFAKLADEYAYEDMGAVSSDYVSQITSQQNDWGWWKNVDFTSDTSAIRWSNFINDARYANEGLGAFEGGLTYWSGVWRPTENSIMRYNTGGFNAPSREAIYYRIHKLAYGDSWEYDYEEFVEWDAINRTAAAAAKRKSTKPATYKPTHAPIIVNKSWRDAK